MNDVEINGITYPEPQWVELPGKDGKPVRFDIPKPPEKVLNGISTNPPETRAVFEADEEIRQMLTSPFNFKGSVADMTALTAISNPAQNDTYYVEALKCRYSWTGSGWKQSSMEESAYEDELTAVRGDLLGAVTGTDRAVTPPDTWRLGSVKASNGTMTDSTIRMRTGYVTIGRRSRISCAEGYKCVINVYSGPTPNQYEGILQTDGTLEKAACWHTGDVWLGTIADRSWRIVILLGRSDDQEMDLSEAANVTIHAATDWELKEYGVPADAQAVGERIEGLEQYNAVETASTLVKNISQSTSRGITYSMTDGVLSVSGTNTGTNLPIVLDGGVAAIPAWIEEGKSYYVDLHTSDPQIMVTIPAYDADGNWVRNLFTGAKSGMFSAGSLDGIAGIVVRYWLVKKTAFDGVQTATLRILNAPPNGALWSGMAEEAGGISLRVMQYNIGKFRQGYTTVDKADAAREAYPTRTGQIVTAANYSDKLANLKRFFGQYHPDVLGLQEHVPYILNTSEGSDHYAHDVLWDGLFSAKSDSRGSESSPQIFASCGLIGVKTIGLTGDAEHPTVTVSDPGGYVPVTNWRFGVLSVGGKLIAVATGALFTTSSGNRPSGVYTDEEWAAEWANHRRAQMQDLVRNYLDDYDYAIVLLDGNSNLWRELDSQGQETDVIDPASPMLSVFAECDAVGMTAAMGWRTVDGTITPYYWPAVESYVQHPNAAQTAGVHRYLDNVIVKGNVKIRNFQVLTEEYDGLVSDHIPVIADLYIW